MKNIVTIAAVAALATLAACSKTDAPEALQASEANATEAAANESVAPAADVGKPADEHVEAAAPAADAK